MKKSLYYPNSEQGKIYQSQKVQQTLTKKIFLISISLKTTTPNNTIIEKFFG
jgi:hypothetical protein